MIISAPPTLSRRAFLGTTTLAVSAMAVPRLLSPALAAAPAITVSSRTIEVNGKAAKVFGVTGPGGRSGLIATEGDRFAGTLENATTEPLQMHWHGQVRAPADQDRARPGGGMLAAGRSDIHDFELTPGTHWMHAHSLSEQQLLAAPMVTLEKAAGDVQEVIVMLHDFAFRTPEEILAELGGSNAHRTMGAPADPSGTMMSGNGMARRMMGDHMMGGQMMSGPMMMGGHTMGMSHANDVRYDAYLANDRTLADPEIVKVDKGGRVRLRIINGGTATAFFVSAPGLPSQCVAVDGNPCVAVTSPSYPLAQGQRIDLVVQIPANGGAFPVLAQVEDMTMWTGIILATAGATIAKLPMAAAATAGRIGLAFEAGLAAEVPLAARNADKRFMMMLGEEPGYRWTINGRVHGEHQPFEVVQGDRVEMTFMNPTSMMHPLHLHGHHFQVVGLGRRRFSGAVRDTVMVPAHMPVTIAFDASHKGSWFLHCHHLYHMATGMMTEVNVV